MKALLETSMKNIPTNLEIANSFKIISPMQDYKIIKNPTRNPNPKWRGENTLSRIKRRNKLRVGYYKNAAPFSFTNKEGVLVGYGIDLAHLLASDLDVTLEFIPISPSTLIKNMNRDYYDIVMSDIFLSSKYAEKIELSKPYLNVSLALLTRKENTIFDDFDTTSKLDTFTISYIERGEIAKEFLSYFPKGGAYPISNISDFYEINKVKTDSTRIDSIHIDAHLTSAERASALTIYKPGYKVVNPLPYHLNNALVFPLARDNVWRRYVDKWIDFRKKDGSFQHIYDQWILGKEFKKEKESWSIYNNILKPKRMGIKDENNKVKKDSPKE